MLANCIWQYTRVRREVLNRDKRLNSVPLDVDRVCIERNVCLSRSNVAVSTSYKNRVSINCA